MDETVIYELAQKDFIVFSGTGPALSAGVLSWEDLLKKLSEEVDLNIHIRDSKEYPIIAQKIFDKLKENGREKEYYNIIQKYINPSVSDCSEPQIEIVWTTNWIVTTNFDSSFEKAFEKYYKIKHKNNNIYIETLPNFTWESHFHHPTVIYLHGKANENYIIFKEDDYKKYYPSVSGIEESSKYLESYLNYLYENHILVFIGFGFEPYILQSFKNFYKDLEVSDMIGLEKPNYIPKLDKIKHYCFIKEVSERKEKERERQEQLISDLESINIKVIKVREHRDWTKYFESIRELRQGMKQVSGGGR